MHFPRFFLCLLSLLYLYIKPVKSETTGQLRDSVRGIDYVIGFPKDFFVNFYRQGISPFTASKKEFLVGTGIVVASAALILVDVPIDNKVRYLRDDSKVVGYVSPKVTELGSSASIIPVIGYAAAGLIFKRPKIVETGLMAIESTIQSGLWIRGMKMLSGRERPSSAYKSQVPGGIWTGPRWLNLWGGQEVDAFPSGHTGTAFSIAATFALQYRDIKFVPVFAYSLATIVGLSRMTQNTHWASDVLLGGAVGYACARQVWKSHKPFQHSGIRSLEFT